MTLEEEYQKHKRNIAECRALDFYYANMADMLVNGKLASYTFAELTELSIRNERSIYYSEGIVAAIDYIRSNYNLKEKS
jgi:hypothetical protein